MAILLGYVKGDTAYMATDTRINVDDRVHQRTAESDYKIKRLENGILLGVISKTADIALQTQAHSEMFTLDKNGRLTKDHIIREIVPKLCALYKDEGFFANEKGEQPYFPGAIMLAHDGKLFEICATLAVVVYERYQALGRVDDLAHYGLTQMDESKDIGEQLVGILQTVAKRSQLVGAPYLWIDTKEKEYHLVGGEA